jgi:hypothetical protein
VSVLEEFVAGANLLDECHVGILVLEVLPGHLVAHERFQQDFKVGVTAGNGRIRVRATENVIEFFDRIAIPLAGVAYSPDSVCTLKCPCDAFRYDLANRPGMRRDTRLVELVAMHDGKRQIDSVLVFSLYKDDIVHHTAPKCRIDHILQLS